MEKNNLVQVDDQEIEDLAASRASQPLKGSSPASLNIEKLTQEQEGFRIIDEETEKPREDSVSDGELVATNSTRTDKISGVNSTEDGDDDLEIVMGTEADVTDEDLLMLGSKDQDLDDGEDEQIATSSLDSTDEDGDALNEDETPLYATGDDLDSGDIDPNDPDKDAMGQGDEENSYYSLGSDDNDNVTEGTP